MKIDTHTHLLLTKKSEPDWRLIKFHFEVARAHGLDVVCITEHIDATYFTALYTELFINNRLGGEILADGIVRLPNSLIIVSGTEIPLKGGGEVGLHTNLSTILSLNKENCFYTLEDLINIIPNKTNEYVMIGNHLYVPGKWIEHIEEKLNHLDAIEMLAKEIHRKEKYKNLAIRLKKPLITGSDSHVWIQLGLGYNTVDIKEYSFKAFKEALKNNLYSMEISPNAENMTKVSMLYRELLTSELEPLKRELV